MKDILDCVKKWNVEIFDMSVSSHLFQPGLELIPGTNLSSRFILQVDVPLTVFIENNLRTLDLLLKARTTLYMLFIII